VVHAFHLSYAGSIYWRIEVQIGPSKPVQKQDTLTQNNKEKKNKDCERVWWCEPVMPALRRWRWEDFEFEASLAQLHVEALSQKTNNQNNKKKRIKNVSNRCF
jgi:hypothetical protein